MKPAREQFERLAIEQMDMLYRVAKRLTRNGGQAEDLVQETYVRALGAREGFDLQRYGIRPWLLRIMHNLHLNRAQREGRQPQAVEDDQLESAGPMDAGLPIDPKSFESMDERLVAALDSLQPEYSAVLMLWAVEEFTYREIAEAMEIPIGTVMSRLHRARQRLGEQLRGFAAAEGIIRE